VGLFNLLCLWPFFVILDVAGIEEFSWPSRDVFWKLVLNGLLGTCLSDYLWLLAMLMTSPVVVTLGLSMTIPLAMGVDAIMGKFHPTPSYWLGTLFIFSSFLAINLSKYFEGIDASVQRFFSSMWKR